jgi:hypothetical protein
VTSSLSKKSDHEPNAGDENSPNAASPNRRIGRFNSDRKSSNRFLDALDATCPDPNSPTKRNSKGSSPLLPILDFGDTLNVNFSGIHGDLSYLELLPIECDLSSETKQLEENFSFQPMGEESETLPEEELESDVSSESEASEPESPTMKRFKPILSKPDIPALEMPNIEIVSEVKRLERTPVPPIRSSIMPLFDTAPLFSKRPVPHLPTPSRIPKPTNLGKMPAGVPGIRMPGEMHLSYASNEPQSNVLPRLDLLVDVAPKCAVYLSSPYPRLTKYANHSTKFYEQRVAEKTVYSPAPTPSFKPTHIVMFAETPKKPNPVPTSASTGIGKGETRRKATVPVSPKLATAARNRKCQCCEGGVHGHHKHTAVSAARTTVGKTQTSMRRRPGSPPTQSRPSQSRIAGPTTVFKGSAATQTPAKGINSNSGSSGVSHRHIGTLAETPRITTKEKDSIAKRGQTTSKKPKLNLTTSLPEFKQPLASIAPTPDPTRTEMHERMHMPLPPIPKTPLFPKSHGKSNLRQGDATTTPSTGLHAGAISSHPTAAPTPIKMPSLADVLGPNYRMVQAFNASHPMAGPLNERDLLR